MNLVARFLIPRRIKSQLMFLMLLSCATVLDLVDWVVIGMIPGFGDVFDVVGYLMLAPFIGGYALPILFELVPGIDVLPTFIVVVLAARFGWGGGR